MAKCIHRVCKALVENHIQEFVTFPTGDDLKDVINGYHETWGFPDCGGAIDGTHIPIIGPSEAQGDYLNRKGYYSLIMQGVCDNKYIFRDIYIGWPGRVHDARVFANSELYHRGENSVLFPNWMRTIDMPDRESAMPVVLLGDPAYPLKHWLMKPYADRNNLTND